MLGDQAGPFEDGDVLLYRREAHGVVAGQLDTPSSLSIARRRCRAEWHLPAAAKTRSVSSIVCIDTTNKVVLGICQSSAWQLTTATVLDTVRITIVDTSHQTSSGHQADSTGGGVSHDNGY